jgi:hypothetical protein
MLGLVTVPAAAVAEDRWGGMAREGLASEEHQSLVLSEVREVPAVDSVLLKGWPRWRRQALGPLGGVGSDSPAPIEPVHTMSEVDARRRLGRDRHCC